MAAQLLEKGYRLSIYDPMVSIDRIRMDLYPPLLKPKTKQKSKYKNYLINFEIESTMKAAFGQHPRRSNPYWNGTN